MSDVLEFDGLELSYGTTRILQGVYVKCAVGEVVGILGRNGSGKSSLFKVVFGIQQASHRSIRVNDRPLPEDFIKRRIIGYLPQGNLVPPHVSIRKALSLFRVDPGVVMNYFPEFEEQLDLKPDELSGGTRRVIELLLVLKSRARFVMLDEPFSGVMPVHIEAICNMIQDAKTEKGIILTDHLYRNVLSLADRLYLLANGSTYEIKDHEELISRGYLS
ncbi:ATP-binding cassette domain-containing protein [Chryseolinea sp. T2]|uniref:ATP-binding cassette domain-containing protein n=1 Tax=Chryseolinea sp. T2 TaxID=3129255 RepID=UPI0030782ED0